MHRLHNPLHKLLQGLLVPEEQNASSMTQAEAFQGSFLRELDEDEKKWFTPSELLLYEHAVEYRYIPVHTSTYQYIPVPTSTSVVYSGTYQYIPVQRLRHHRNAACVWLMPIAVRTSSYWYVASMYFRYLNFAFF